MQLAAEPPFKVVYSEKAVARELIPPERQNLAYLCRREFRGGQVFVRVLMKNRPRPGRALLHASIGFAQWALASLRAIRDKGVGPRVARASAAGKMLWRQPDMPGPYR